MTSIFKTIVSLFIMVLALLGSFRAMNAMLVHDDASIVLDAKACPVKLDDDGYCVMHGSISHSLMQDNAKITVADGLWVVSDKSVLSVMYTDEKSRYEPLGKFIAGAVGLLILVIGCAIGFLFSYRPILMRKKS